MTKQDKINTLIQKYEQSLQKQADFRLIRREIVKLCKTLTRAEVEKLWEDKLKNITAEYEKKAPDAMEMARTTKYYRWQARTNNAKQWLVENCKDCQKYAERKANLQRRRAGLKSIQAEQHIEVERSNMNVNHIVIPRPIDEEKVINAIASLYSEAGARRYVKPVEIDRWILAGRKRVIR